MRALVTGSAGFIGRHMVAALVRRGWQVNGWDITASKYFAEFTTGGDCMYLFQYGRLVPPYDLVVHAAARSPHRAAIDGDPGMHPYNAMLDAAMFDWAIRTEQRHVLYLSSCAALDGPVDDYAAGKLEGERLAACARRAGVPVTVVRPYSGYGEDQSEDFPFRAIIERARRREDPFPIWGNGLQVRDWIHVSDVVAGALAVIESGTEEPVSLCTGVGTSILDLMWAACAVAGYRPNEFRTHYNKPAGAAYRVGDPTRLLAWYTPQVTLEQGIKRALGG